MSENIQTTSELLEQQSNPIIAVPDPVLSMIERAASDPAVNVEKLERLMAMQERVLDRNARNDFARSMHSAQSEIRAITTNKTNDQTGSKYPTYAKLDAEIRPIYTKHGFSVTFGTEPCATPASVLVVADVMHVGGHEKRYQIEMPADGKGAKGGDVMTKTHATGSAVSYGMRYLTKGIWNIAIADDDGNAAGKRIEYLSEEQSLELHALLVMGFLAGEIAQRKARR